ncbi:hypothetical protein PIB30_021579 [Stylosanthes scabra]|uniref:Single-stranded DNA binding protein Ssb-like OB fold domain-containing protein n=1 Tax=Stylosanthes scabra TaxID=79078 RepID=A0ABU6T973_9FABA|nr:hypothetical protein [Stylosanthes scabra]
MILSRPSRISECLIGDETGTIIFTARNEQAFWSSSCYSRWRLYSLCALYQLHLVKAEKARRHIPKEFKLVEAFGFQVNGVAL